MTAPFSTTTGERARRSNSSCHATAGMWRKMGSVCTSRVSWFTFGYPSVKKLSFEVRCRHSRSYSECEIWPRLCSSFTRSRNDCPRAAPSALPTTLAHRAGWSARGGDET
eukprot:3294023-Rhodomonas_salina.1